MANAPWASSANSGNMIHSSERRLANDAYKTFQDSHLIDNPQSDVQVQFITKGFPVAGGDSPYATGPVKDTDGNVYVVARAKNPQGELEPFVVEKQKDGTFKRVFQSELPKGKAAAMPVRDAKQFAEDIRRSVPFNAFNAPPSALPREQEALVNASTRNSAYWR